ncbi:hypothetical protein CL617_01050 [archaeon]|nr:hypothetical protein [archaeon]|tara:strand:+ start:11222 stop:12298 length:1077 start_codon:yes stop_codon:yes gene_type:complete
MGINYSMCWEDPEVLNRALDISNKDDVLSIVSGGENLFAILLNNPRNLIGIDINKEQIYITKLKIAAIKTLNFEEFIQFLGFNTCENRLSLLDKIKVNLTKEEIDYWEDNRSFITDGIIHCGKFERYLERFRKYFLPLIISKKGINQFLRLGSLENQEEYYEKYWDTWRFRLIFRLFFSKKGIKKGRDEEYFNYSKKENISNHYFMKTKYALTKIPIKTNYFMQYILTGKILAPFKYHPYLDKDNFQLLKRSVNKIKFINRSVNEYIKEQSDNKFSKFNLSDIFELNSQNEYEDLMEEIARLSKENGKICYWNNLVPRFKHIKNKNLIMDNFTSNNLHSKDRVHFYSRFILEDINLTN